MSYRNFGIDLGAQKAVNMADGTALTDGATYGQVVAARQGFDLKDPVRVVSVTNQASLSGLLTIDGVTVAAGDRVLLAGQTTASQNGVYVAASGTWARATDADENAEVTPGFTVAVLQGTQKGTGATQANVIRYSLTNLTAPTIGTTSLNFAPEGSSGSAYSAGNGLTLAGTTFSVNADGTTLIADGTNLRVSPTYAGRALRYSQDIGAASAGTAVQITHSLGTLDVIWQIRRVSDGVLIDFPDTARDANSVTITPPLAITAGQYRFTAIA